MTKVKARRNNSTDRQARRNLMLGLLGILSIALASGFSAVLPGEQAFGASPAKSCQWVLDTGIEDATQWGWGDSNARYAIGVFPIPPGGYVELKGQYPHNRYFALGTYFVNFNGIDQIRDFQIVPDRGSTNPFQSGADRNAKNRSYTVRIVNARVPSGQRPINTLYTDNGKGTFDSSTKPLQTAFVFLRSYLPDRGRDQTGGVGWPQATTVTSTGQRIELPDCPTVEIPGVIAPAGIALGGFLPQGPGGYTPPRWELLKSNVADLMYIGIENALLTQLGVTSLISKVPDGVGIGQNLDTKYLATGVSSSHGAVVVFDGRLPITPHTLADTPSMGAGQMRYWSMCSYMAETQQRLACVADEQLPLDKSGHYRIVVSPARDRPANARAACGYAWLPMAPGPSFLVTRNILVDPSFAHSNQRIPKRGDEKRVLGAYYPEGRYYATKTDVEALGCHQSASLRRDDSSAAASQVRGTDSSAGPPAYGARGPRKDAATAKEAELPARQLGARGALGGSADRDGSPVPNEAGRSFGWVLTGLGLVFSGTAVLVRKRRRKQAR